MQTEIRSMHLHQPQEQGTEVSISHHVEIVNFAAKFVRPAIAFPFPPEPSLSRDRIYPLLP
jgi:hypothetical protein